MDNTGRRATIVGIGSNALLFFFKFLAGIMTGSLAIFSDALNSLSDTAYSVAVFMAVRVSQQKPDEDHPFGHRRAEPVAALLVAILSGILGFELIKEGLGGVLAPQAHLFSLLGVAVLLGSMTIKAGMWLYFKRTAKRMGSPAISASSVDSRNDVLISLVALLGFSGPALGMPNLDFYAGIVIGGFIIWSGYKIGEENIGYLMGKSPGKEVLDEIRRKAKKVDGVGGIHDIRAHYVGDRIHVHIHAEVDGKLRTEEAHRIGKRVEGAVESSPLVNEAFVHVDPR